MSHDLRHQQEWQKEHPDSNNINKEAAYGVMYWSCGMGWQVPTCTLTLEEARELKTRYESTNTQPRIFLEVK